MMLVNALLKKTFKLLHKKISKWLFVPKIFNSVHFFQYNVKLICSLPIMRRIFVISASVCPEPIRAGMPPVILGEPIGGRAPPGETIGDK